MPRLLALVVAAIVTQAAAFDLQGHRGARGLAPENSLPGFARALSLGVTTLELDVGVTADSVVVVSHDRRLNPDIVRGPDGQWLAARGRAIHELTFHELQRYDVGRISPGSDYSRRFPDQRRDGRRPHPAAGGRVRARAEGAERRDPVQHRDQALAARARGDADHEAFARALIKARCAPAASSAATTIQSFDWRTLAVVQREAPEIATAYLTDGRERARRGRRGVALDDGIRFADHGSVPKMVKTAGGAIWSPATATSPTRS